MEAVPNPELTERELQALAFIRECRYASPPTSPTEEEIAEHMTRHTTSETCSLAYAARLVVSLEEKKVIRRQFNADGQPLRRSITLASEHDDAHEPGPGDVLPMHREP